MFVGHTSIALAAKSRVPAVSLGWWMAAAFALDLLWPFFLLAGVERVKRFSGRVRFKEGRLWVRGESRFKMSDFGIKPPQYLLFRVKDEVGVGFDLLLERRP